MRAPYILSADDVGDFSWILWETLHFGGRRFQEHAVERLWPPKKAMDFTFLPVFAVSESGLIASSVRHLVVAEQNCTPHLGSPHLKVPDHPFLDPDAVETLAR